MTHTPDVDLFDIMDAIAAKALADKAEAEARAKEEAEAAEQARLNELKETYGIAKGPLLLLIQRSVSISMPRSDTGDPDPARFNPDYLDGLFWLLERFVDDPDKVVSATIRRTPPSPPTRPAPVVKTTAPPKKQAVQPAPAAPASKPQPQVKPVAQPVAAPTSVVAPVVQQQAGTALFDQKQAVQPAPAAPASKPQPQVKPVAQPVQAITATRVLQPVNVNGPSSRQTSGSRRDSKPGRSAMSV